ncbi:LacI family DNA-binding transcriptional regulator [Salinactinospora qingdaonensis]|uniref:LacI family DNA-binding transcriptional regulator n=1 Tax=Salinactinospora qingdaonensis TaxID=702744 RepID=A0ABP7FG03_9ACTN
MSYALNGRPGVSEATRQRILDIAGQLGWAPSSAARALSDGRADAMGLVVDRPAAVLGNEPFFMQLISGIQSVLSGEAIPLLLQSSTDRELEMDIYRRWYAERRVDGVIMVDLRHDDPRLAAINAMRMPAVIIGGPYETGGIPCVWSNDAKAMHDVVRHLAGLGHEYIARVAGPENLVHTTTRSEAFAETVSELGLPDPEIVYTDYSGEQGATVTRSLLSREKPPTAIIFDNDLMAVAALGVAQEFGISVPERLSVVAWDDSPLCRLVHPALTTITRDIVEHGSTAATMLMDLAEGEEAHSRGTSPAQLVTRASTGPAPR